jgi:hypothetical protein
MCGIFGVRGTGRSARQPRVLAPWQGVDSPRPDDQGTHMEPGGVGMRRLSTSISRPTSAPPQRGWFRLDGLQRGNLQLSRTDGRPSGPRPSLRNRFRHRDARASLRGTWRRLRPSPSRHVRLRSLGCTEAHVAPGAGPSGEQAALLRAACTRPGLRFRAEGIDREPGCSEK